MLARAAPTEVCDDVLQRLAYSVVVIRVESVVRRGLDRSCAEVGNDTAENCATDFGQLRITKPCSHIPGE